MVLNHFYSSSTTCLSGLSGSHVCPLSFESLFVCVVEVSGVSHFYFGTLWPVILIFNGGEKKIGMQTGKAVCDWVPARLSNRASL